MREALLRVCAAIAPLIEHCLTLDALVAELSCLISNPGAIRQPWHPDSLLPSPCGVPLYTCFVALQSIDPSMGPTRVLPGTHSSEWHGRLRDEGARGNKARRKIESMDEHMACEVGDAFLMDSRLWHCGGSNGSAQRRRVLYVSFNAPHCLPRGSTYSILGELAGRLRLRHLLSESTPAKDMEHVDDVTVTV